MSTIKSDTLSTLSGAYSVPTETLARASCKAWVNFNGTGTVAIRRAFNVSSITDNGTGDYTVNFTNAMVDANYSSPSQGGSLFGGATPFSKTSGAYRVQTYNTSSTLADYADISVAIFS